MPRGEIQARTSLRNLSALPRLQRLCARYSVRPTYLVSYPAAVRPEAEWLREIVKAGHAEVGAYLQPWNTPPFEANEDRLIPRSPAHVPASAISAKLKTLTETIEREFGHRPTCHRAAQFGLNGACLQTLERLGYTVDTSVTPLTDGREEGGIDWRDAPATPYFPDRQRPIIRGASPILEVPVSVAWDRDFPGFLGRALVKLPSPIPLRALLSNPTLPLTQLTWLDPCQHSGRSLRKLARSLLERGHPVLNVPLRSNQCHPGESAACSTAEDVDALFESLEALLRHTVDELRAEPRTLSEFASYYLDEVAGL